MVVDLSDSRDNLHRWDFEHCWDKESLIITTKGKVVIFKKRFSHTTIVHYI